jgi:hypothetical protein
VSPHDFDAFVCGSGSEVYYPAESGIETELQVDADYQSHIDYRWGYNGLRKTMPRITSLDGEVESKNPIFIEDEETCNPHCLAYRLTKPDSVSNFTILKESVIPMSCSKSFKIMKSNLELGLNPRFQINATIELVMMNGKMGWISWGFVGAASGSNKTTPAYARVAFSCHVYP